MNEQTNQNQTTCPTCKGAPNIYWLGSEKDCPICHGTGTIPAGQTGILHLPEDEQRALFEKAAEESAKKQAEVMAGQTTEGEKLDFEDSVKQALREVLLKSGQFSNTSYTEPDLGAWRQQLEDILGAHTREKHQYAASEFENLLTPSQLVCIDRHGQDGCECGFDTALLARIAAAITRERELMKGETDGSNN